MPWAIGIICFCLMVAGGWWGSGLEALTPAGREPNSIMAAEPTGAQLTFQPHAGSLYAYKFTRFIRIKGLSNSVAPIEFAGDLFLNILTVNEKGFSAVVSDQVLGQASSTVSLKIIASRTGERLEIFRAPPSGVEIDQQHEAVLKDLVSLFFFPTAEDSSGEYSARIEKLPAEGDILPLRKTKIAYAPPSKIAIVSSKHLIRWSQKLRMPLALEGEDHNRLGWGDLASESGYNIHFVNEMAAPKLDSALLKSLAHVTHLKAEPVKLSLRDHPDYARLNWAELAASLRLLGTLSSSEQLKLFGDLVKLLEIDPSKISTLSQMLQSEGALKQGAQSKLFQQVVGALATNGSAAAQSELVALYQNSQVPVSGKGTILAALTTTQSPLDESTLSFLRAVMAGDTNKDLAQGAAFALGSALAEAPNGDQTQRAVTQILAAWASARDSASRLALLDVMGNSGRLEFYSAVSKATRATEPAAVRSRAAFSLRFMKSVPAHELLAQSLGDAEVSVRGAAAAGMRLAAWNDSWLNPIQHCSLHEADTQVRNLCLEIQNRRTAVASAN